MIQLDFITAIIWTTAQTAMTLVFVLTVLALIISLVAFH